GATSLWLTIAEGADPGSLLDTVLDEVLLDLAPVVLDAGLAARSTAEAFLAHLRGRDVAPHPATNLGADPVAVAVRSGETPEDGALEDLVAVAGLARDAGVLGVVVDGTAVHDHGASDAQELGYAVATGAAYLRALVDAGLDVDTAAGLVEFRLAATDEQFPTIAKLRAARRLWARVLELSGAESRVQRQHAVTSRPMMSAYDPYVNMLRTTVAAFAAGVGGADAVTVLPFDSPLGRSEAFGRRIARNVSHLLVEESHLGKVTDPAGGAYAVERLTDDLARAGWAELGRIEESGGVLAALADGSLRARVDEVAAQRDRLVAERKRPLTGVSEFPDAAETRLEREPDPTQPAVRRYGAAFEALRDEPRGQVFLASMGTVAAHTARVTFASNLFAAGGVAVAYPGPLADVEAAVSTYDGAPVVCLCGSDAAYADWGPALVTALREAGARHVVVAGKPAVRGPDGEVHLEVDDSCAMGVDALAFLTRTREVSA
ncbi:methylmalonyl-CoA mutase family protein, partial [Nocardioides sp.]|uniref:methylmalonyl-CoA mutase family protein n=1 Tax=Nocardioides sp. TaxID=35761 RepID=UPI002733A72D